MAPVVPSRKVSRIALVCLLLLSIGFGLLLVYWHFCAAHHIRQAEKALQLQRYRLALGEYKQAIRYRSGSATLHLLAARTARQARDLATAREHLNRARELQKGVSEEQQLEGYLIRVQSGEIDEVHRYLLPYLLEEGPYTPLVLEALFQAYMGKYRVDLAWRALHRWIELEPDNVEALFRRATWYTQQQNLKEAAADYYRVLERDPLRSEVRAVYAEILQYEKKFEEAAEQYQILLQQSPQDPAALLGQAQCYVNLWDLEEARKVLAALPDTKDTADVLCVRGMVELRSNQLQKAELFLRRALEEDPGHFDACFNLMLCLQRLGRKQDAETIQARVKQIETDQKRLIAITTLELNKSPKSPELHCEMGEIYLRLGHSERGVHWLLTALKFDPAFRRAHERLRDYYDSLGPEGKEKADYHRRLAAR